VVKGDSTTGYGEEEVKVLEVLAHEKKCKTEAIFIPNFPKGISSKCLFYASRQFSGEKNASSQKIINNCIPNK
jgi:hypothetical protein